MKLQKSDWITGPPKQPGYAVVHEQGETSLIWRSDRRSPADRAVVTHHIPIEMPPDPDPPKPEPGWYVVRFARGDLRTPMLVRKVTEDSDFLLAPPGELARGVRYTSYEFGPKLPDGWEP